MSIDRQNTKVTMSLEDYEMLKAYEKAYNSTIKELKALTYIDSMTSEEIVVVLKKKALQDYIVPFAANDVELDGYPDGVKVVWK